jgi:hypothetical protein
VRGGKNQHLGKRNLVWLIVIRTSSAGKIAFTNNLVEVFEIEIDTYGIFFEKVWEWK